MTLPNGWAYSTVGDVLEVNYGKGLKESARDATGHVPVYGSNGKVGQHSTALVSGPCLIIGRKGAAGAVHLSRTDCWPIDTTYWTRPPAELSLEYAYYVLRTLNLSSLDRSTAIPGLNRDDLYSQVIPIAPLPEQHRIVAEIEKQFTRLDAGMAALRRVQANLKRYKASVLKAACEGRLVPQDPNDEPASELLARILEQRRKGAVTAPQHEPASPDTDGLPELPVGWCWTTLGQLGKVIGGFAKNSKRSKHDLQLPYLRVANVYAGELRLDDVQTIGIEESELERLLLQKGDLLVVEGNGSIDQIGRVAVWDGSISSCIHQNHIIKVRLGQIEIGKYAVLWLLSRGGRDQITRVASSTSGLYTLSLSKVSVLPVPLPPLAEQRRIVTEVERRLSVVQEVEAVIAANLARAKRLRQSILKQAFEGKLVAQDPNDEPASVLLERIKAHRAGAALVALDARAGARPALMRRRT